MGSNMAYDLASNDLLDLDLETQLEIHLTSNHYPPVPISMVAPCIDAIDAYYDEDYDRLIKLPEGVSWRGQNTSPAYALVDAHHLSAWLPEAEQRDQGCEATHTLGISYNKIGVDKCQTPLV